MKGVKYSGVSLALIMLANAGFQPDGVTQARYISQ